MPTLSTFFKPLNFENLLIYVLLFIFFDSVGFYLFRLIFPKFEAPGVRIIKWVLGLGFFSFVWFLLSLHIPYTPTNIILSIVVISLFCLPDYVRRKRYLDIFKYLWSVRAAVLVIIPFLPAVFVKASLPPYYGDEMAYHYIPPSALLALDKVKYVGGLYADLPRTLNIFWELVFSLTSTYSIARLFHFTILASSMLFAYGLLKRWVNLLTAFLFVFVFFSLPQDVVLTSTLGYVDVGAYSFILMALISTVGFVVSERKEFIVLVVLFWSLNLGTKYTGISAAMAFISLSPILLGVLKKNFSKLFLRPFVIKLAFVALIFGGYWYVKNLVLFGNPVFPFVFDCWGSHIEPCGQNGSFFGEWTTKVNFSNLKLILSQLFVRNYILRFVIICAPLLFIFSKESKFRKISAFFYLAVVLELAILSKFSGFYARYHQHMQLYLLLGCLILVTSKSRNFLGKYTRYFFIGLVLASSIYFYLLNIRFVNSLKFLNWNEISYSLSRINIYGWISANFPRMKDVIFWCDGGDGKEFVNLARFDPDLIWFDHDGLMRVFLIRCKYINPNVDTSLIGNIIPSAVENRQKFWISSSNRCVDDKDVKPKFEYETPAQSYLRNVDNKIICNSKEITPNLYFFDYNNLLIKP